MGYLRFKFSNIRFKLFVLGHENLLCNLRDKINFFYLQYKTQQKLAKIAKYLNRAINQITYHGQILLKG